MRRSNTVFALLLVGTLALPAVSYAQANTSPDNDQSVLMDNARDTNDESNWGWLGLLGLAGLLGLKRRDRDDHRDHVTARQPV